MGKSRKTIKMPKELLTKRLADASAQCIELLEDLENGGAENPELATLRAALAAFRGAEGV